MAWTLVGILDQGGNGDREIVGLWVVLKVEPTGFLGGLDEGHKEWMESRDPKF